MTHQPDPSSTPELVELLQAMRGHLDGGLRLAKRGLAAAERAHHRQLEQFFRSCLQELGRAAESVITALGNGDAVAPADAEQVSSASFAPGDGANDAQVVPEGAYGKAGNWPSD